jgi:hypothetical protein
MKRLKYLWAHDNGRTFDYPIQALQRELTARGVGHFRNSQFITRGVGYALAKLQLMRRIADVSQTAYLAPIMLVSESRLFPVCYFAETLVYAMDVWPPRYAQWEAFFRRHRMRVAFISARISAQRMTARVPGLEAIWLPEAINPALYVGDKPLTARRIDVLEMGRRHAAYHEKIVAHCAVRGCDHRYERVRGEIIFPTYDEFIRALGDSKVSVCFPSSMTHPERAGDVETMTLRYLESIAARAILIGHCPAELRDLFGYDPVIAWDQSDPAGQLDTVLADPARYQELVDRNYRRLLEVGTWSARVTTLLDLLAARGYSPRGRDGGGAGGGVGGGGGG